MSPKRSAARRIQGMQLTVQFHERANGLPDPFRRGLDFPLCTIKTILRDKTTRPPPYQTPHPKFSRSHTPCGDTTRSGNRPRDQGMVGCSFPRAEGPVRGFGHDPGDAQQPLLGPLPDESLVVLPGPEADMRLVGIVPVGVLLPDRVTIEEGAEVDSPAPSRGSDHAQPRWLPSSQRCFHEPCPALPCLAVAQPCHEPCPAHSLSVTWASKRPNSPPFCGR